ncbi:D-amino-acid transaminase [Aestuariivirga litoralis]|uniref:D-amino-acid transaminase n=1 Tax=Aestuariivirga litoralis TaxID=2650924 RepID=UPI0018C4929E|nr:D-amino-acid transaminase [Aestuariivirga litoralis]MBG1233599.1 D-amino-acid transaminase [Aestuariivirga litoralis]
MSRICYVNGQYQPEGEAKVSIFDRGFLFGDGVYEVTPIVNSNLVDYDAHMERLGRSLGELKMAWPCTKDEMRAMHLELVKRNSLVEGMIYMQVTRGVADRQFNFPKDIPSTLIAFTQVAKLVDNPYARTGIKVITTPDIRWGRRDIKTVMLLASVLGKQAAVDQGVTDAWMVQDGKITEGTSNNAFIVKDGKVITRPLSNEILAGCTRRALFRLAKEQGVEIVERQFTPEEAYAADEAFITSASQFVMPVTEIDGKRIGGGQPGPVSRKMRDLFLEEAQKA